MNTTLIAIAITIAIFVLIIQILSAFIAWKIAKPKIYSLKQIVDEDSKGTQKIFDLKKYMFKGPLKKEVLNENGNQIKYEIWGEESFKKYVILVHGISNRKERMLKYAKVWNDLGYNAVIFDGRGYNEHKFMGNSTFGFKESDLVNMIKYDVESKNEILSIGLHGESMGAATVFNWVKKYKKAENIDFIVAESGYFSFFRPAVQGMKNRKVPKLFGIFLMFFITRWLILIAGVNLLSLKINKRDMKKFTMPIMLINTKADRIVPLSESESIKRKLKENDIAFSEFEVEGSKHVRILTDENNQKEWINNLEQFVKEINNEK